MLDNQTPESFQDVSKPKYNGTLNLDRWAPPSSPPSSPRPPLHGLCTGVQRPGYGPLLGSDCRSRGGEAVWRASRSPGHDSRWAGEAGWG